MFRFFSLLKRFVLPYKKYVFLNVFFHLLSAFLTLFSFAALIPILQILFGISGEKLAYMDWDWELDTLSYCVEAIKNNLMFTVQTLTVKIGGSWALLFLSLFLIFSTFLKTLTSFLGSYFMIPIRTGVLRDLRNQIYSKSISLPIGFFTSEKKGDLMSRMTNDVGEVENSIMSSLDMILKNPLLITIYLGTMIFMSWQLTIFVLILLPIGGGLIGKIGKSLKHKSSLGQEQTGEMLSQIEETLSSLRVIKAFNAEETMKNSFGKLNDKIRRTFNNINRRHALAHPVSEFLGTVIIAIILLYGGSLILNQTSNLSAASFIYYLVIFYSIIAPAKELSKASYSIQKGLASIDRIDKILNAENPIKEKENPTPLKKFTEKIEYKNVCFSYNESREVLKDISITIEKGKTVAFVGQSGSGKTTLIDLLLRLYDVNGGEILIDGVNIKDVSFCDLRGLMGNVNQESILFNDTFYNNIAFGVQGATMAEVIQAAKIANAHDFITATREGYNTSIGDRGSRLSGGQRQRINIARAILRNPSILILDEATSALDTESEKLVQDALEKLMKNRTTLVVAHRLSTIRNADEICVMHDGQIIERGHHDELIALGGYYKRLCEMQQF